MATPAAVLTILVRADTKAATAALGKTDKALKGTATQMDGVDKSSRRSQKSFAALKTGAYAAGGGVVLLGLGAKKAFREFEEAEKVTGQTRAALKSTGEAAKVTAREVENLAAKLSRKSGIDDEAIQSGENLLLTFTKIRNETGKGNDIFNRATTTILDMSVALGQDLKSSAIQVGKALNDPTKGMTALRRVGVSFTAEQEERVKGWVEEGKQLKAQKFILRELTTEFGGSAAAQATGAAKLRVAFDNLFESFGKAFGPTVERGMEKVATALEKVGAIISDPKLTSAEKFGRIMDMVVAQVEKALPKVAEAGGKVAGALAEGVLRAWTGMSPLAKLFSGAALLRVVGGRGAITAAGAAIGRLLGIGIASGAATAAGAGAAGAGGAAVGGGILGAMRSKLLPLAKRAGLVGVGVVLADSVISEFGRRAQEKGPDMFKALEALQGPKNVLGFGDLFGAIDKLSSKITAAGGISILPKMLKNSEEAARVLKPALEEIQKAQGGIGHKKADQLREVIKKLTDASPEVRRWANSLVDSAEDVGQKTKWLQDRFENMRDKASRSSTELKNRVSYNMDLIRQTLGTDSQKGRDAIVENFRSAARNVRKSMDAGTISVKEGTALIRTYLVRAWTTMGFSKADAVALMSRTKGSAQTPMGGELRPNQRGSYISGGRPVGDSVPSVLERGEYVLNRNAVKKVGRRNLDRLNFKDAARFQKGGMAGMVSAANQLERAQFPYLWGGGHQATPAPFGPMDCSGAVSYVLQHGGVNIPTMTSGSMMGIGQPGAGKVTVYANQGHVLMRIGNRFFGTSGSNPGGGAGWIDPAPDAGYLSGFAVRSFDPSGMAGGMFTGEVPRIPKVEASGPDGMVKGVVQGALNLTRKVAQAGVNKVAEQMAPIGTGDPGDPGPTTTGAFGKADLMSLWNRAGGPRSWANRMAASALAESGGDPKAVSSADARGLWQIHWPAHASTFPGKNPFNAMDNAEMAISILESQGWYDAWAVNWNENSWATYKANLQKGGLVAMMKKGGPVGYAGDSLGVGTIDPLRAIFGKDRHVEGRVSGGKSPEWGLGALKGLGKKKAQYVFDFGSNKYGSVGIVQALRQAKAYTGKQPLHTFTLNAGEVEANKKIRGMGGVNVIDWANKHGSLSDGLHGDYGHRARLLSQSIKAAAAATEKPNKPAPKGKLNKRRHLHGLQAPSIKALDDAVNGMRYGPTEAARTNSLNGILDLIRGTGLPKRIGDQIEGLTTQESILSGYADAAGQLSIEDAAGNSIPGTLAGRTEVDYLTDQLNALRDLRNKLIEAQEKLAARRQQIKALHEQAQRHFAYYQRAVTVWGHVINVQEKKLADLRKHPKQNKKQIEAQRALVMNIKAEQVKTVGTRDGLRTIMSKLGDKSSALGDSRGTVKDSLGEVQGAGGPMGYLAELPLPGTSLITGSILTAQLRKLELGAKPTTDTSAVTDITSERDDLLRELGRLTLQRSAVEKLHEITLRDFPDFDRLGVPFGGKFHTGGVVPGPVGAERATVLQGGEGVFTREQMAAMGTPSVTINVAPGMEWLKQFISVEVGRTNRVTARNAGRGLPGRGGGGLGG